jgi:peptidoglycan/xylan/chitin deacetylase (PgdA/CDA1 family)
MAASEPSSCTGYVALTYDDGPTEYTRAVSRELTAHGLTATFFLTGDSVEKYPEVAAELARDQHVGNHTYSHEHLLTLRRATVRSEIADTSTMIENATGIRPVLFRPPYGETDPQVRRAAAAEGMAEVIWTLDTRDWTGRTAEAVAATVGDAEDGDIILMHDDSQADVDAVPQIAAELADAGLCTAPIRASDTMKQAWEGLSFPAEVAAP